MSKNARKYPSTHTSLRAIQRSVYIGTITKEGAYKLINTLNCIDKI